MDWDGSGFIKGYVIITGSNWDGAASTCQVKFAAKHSSGRAPYFHALLLDVMNEQS